MKPSRDSSFALLVGDIHVGSCESMWPLGVENSFGVVPNLTRGQQYLGTNWNKIVNHIRVLTNGWLNVLMMVGDAIQGPADKRRGDGTMEPDLAFQGRAAVEILRPLADMADERFVFKGSAWHVGDFAETEEWVGEQLDAVKNDASHRCWDWLPEYHIAGEVLDVAHHQSYTMINRSMPLEREGRFAAETDALRSLPATVIVRAHTHIMTEVLTDGKLSIGLPSMQLQTGFAKMSRTPNRMISRHLGVCLLEIDPRKRKTLLPAVQTHWLAFKHLPLPKREYVGRNADGD